MQTSCYIVKEEEEEEANFEEVCEGSGKEHQLQMDEDEYSYFEDVPLGSVEDVEVTTQIIQRPRELRKSKPVLLFPNSTRKSAPSPFKIVRRILNVADDVYIVEQKAQRGFQGQQMDHCLFKFGPLPSKPYRVDIHVVSHDQGWSSFPEHQNSTNNSWTFGEVDIKTSERESKLKQRVNIFTNLHAVSKWQTHSLKFEETDSFMNLLEAGDILEMYCRALFPGWVIYVKEAKMTVYYDSPPVETD